MAITGGFGFTFDTKTGTAKPWAFRAEAAPDMHRNPQDLHTSRGTCIDRGVHHTWWLADQLCPVCGSNCSTNGRVVQCLNEQCGWDDAGREHGRG